MSNKQFISNLSSTYADVRKLDVKKINLKGENILDIIKKATPTIKHANDTRETVTENDLWGQYIETLEDGTTIVHDDYVTNPNTNDFNGWNTSITKVEDNKAYVGDTFFANVQTEKIKNGTNMFNNCYNLTTFDSDLSSLTEGSYMFNNCNTLVSFNSNLSSFTNGDYMFNNCKNLTTFTSDLSSLTEGGYMFNNCIKLSSFTSDLSSLTDSKFMFYNTILSEFSSDLSSLTNGYGMFYNCDNLTTFNSDLNNLTSGYEMFSYCKNLTSFNSDLSSLMVGRHMFYGTNLSEFTSDLNSLTKGTDMFSGCDNLTAFISDLSSLVDGYEMFFNCDKLTTFNSDLSSLTNGYQMFNKTKLTPWSVMYIAESIKDIIAEKKLYQDGTIPYVTIANGKYSTTKGFMSDGRYVYTYKTPAPYTDTISSSEVGLLTLGIDVTNDATTIADQLQAFAEEATFDSWADLKQSFVDKGWNVTWQYGGTSNNITYDLRGQRTIPCPVYTQLIEISPEGVEYDEEGNETGNKVYTDEQKNRAEYTNEDGSKFYNIDWGHDVTNLQDFQQFDSLEDAAVAYGVFLKENIITTEEEA